jgi:serine/threonine-protein kinase
MSEEATNRRLNPGERLGKYEILEFVASGGMGRVYKARDVDLDRVVALKVLPPATALQPKMLDRFRREARVAARLHHENIVAIYEFSEKDGMYFLALEYVPGVDLQEYVDKRKKLPPDEAREIILQAARALVHAHEQQVVHRDVKPSNFLLTRKDGRVIVKLTDLGLALHPSDGEYRITREGTTVGTVDYMAPEQARDSASADIRSDIYSLGCTFYHLLAGTAPFAIGTMAERLLQHLQDEPPNVRELNDEVPRAYAVILERMLAKRPEDRYQTPQELLADLENPDRAGRRLARQTPREVPQAKAAPARSRDQVTPVSIPITASTPSPPASRKEETVADAEEPPFEEPRTRLRRAPAAEPEQEDPADSGEYSLGEAPARPRYAPPPEEDEPAVPEEPAAEPRRPRKRRQRERAETRDGPRRDARDSSSMRGTAEVRDQAAPSQPTASQEARDRAREARANSGAPPWAVLGGGAAAIAIIALIGMMVANRSGDRDRKTEPAPPPISTPTPPPITAPAKKDDDRPYVAGNAAEMGIPIPVLPPLYQPVAPLEALRTEYYGSLEPLPAPPSGAPVLRVTRGAASAPAAFRSLAEALAAAPEGSSIIEIHDKGPLFIGTLPAIEGREIHLRAGPGFRPLLAWEPPPSNAKGKSPPVAPVMFTQRRCRLTVSGLDIVVKSTDTDAANPACLFQAGAGQLVLRDCTVSLAGKQPHGVILARLARVGELDPVRLRISGCYARGVDFTALAIEGTSAEVLIDHSILAGNAQPLVRAACRDVDEVKLRIVRSTLVTGNSFMRVQNAAGKGGAPQVQTLVWDAILARNDAAGGEGDLIQLAGGAEPDQLKWRAVNAVYAGWKRLLGSTARSIDGSDLDGWHSQFLYREGDRAALETWPNLPPTQLDELPASVFYAYEPPVGFAANDGVGPLGAPVGQLPVEPTGWLNQTFDRPPLVLTTLTDPETPALSMANDGRYHGERVELPPRADLGVVLGKLMHGKSLASRVVFHIAGSGEHATSPLRVQGVAELVLYFEPPMSRPKSEPLTLTLDSNPLLLQRTALIEVDFGSLEIQGVTIRFENRKSVVMPPHMIKVTGGNLTLHRCQLIGPLGKAPEAFRSLIALAGPANAPLECKLTDCVLLSGRGILQTTGVPLRLAARQNAVLAMGDAVQPDRGLIAELENNTLAVRRALIAPRAGAEPAEPLMVKAAANYFTDPFGDSPAESTLLRVSDALVGRGLLAWRGKGNAFDRRLESYYSTVGTTGAVKQSLDDWLSLWGRSGEQDALAVTATAKAISIDAPQLDRLAVPREVRPESGNAPPGADLNRLGLLKKKG